MKGFLLCREGTGTNPRFITNKESIEEVVDALGCNRFERIEEEGGNIIYALYAPTTLFVLLTPDHEVVLREPGFEQDIADEEEWPGGAFIYQKGAFYSLKYGIEIEGHEDEDVFISYVIEMPLL